MMTTRFSVLFDRHAYKAEGKHRGGLIRLLLILTARARQRHALRDLDLRLLKDVGLAPEDARRETSKPFWRT